MSGAAAGAWRTFGRYRIDALLGRGGMGEVYLAWDPLLQCKVAIKFIHQTEVEDTSSLATVLKEARMASALNHPNICAIKDVVEADGQAGIVMEYVEGQPLSKVIPTGGLAPEIVLLHGAAIADAVAHAHDNGIIHGDLKSGNILISAEGQVKLLDFGLSRFVNEIQAGGAIPRLRSSTGSSVGGTPEYVAPEILRGRVPDRRSDVWSLGALAYEAATGRLPFAGSTHWELATAILRDPPAPLPTNMPPGLQAIILRCLAKDPAQRYQRCGELRAAFEALGSATERKPRRLSVQLKILILVLLLAIAAAGTHYVDTWLNPPLDSVAVLPLATNTVDMEYMSQGITESIADNLMQLPKLKVYRYAGKETDAKRIGNELGVKVVVTGQLVVGHENISINIELSDATDGHGLWGKHYERPASQVIDLQEQIASEIAENLRLQMTAAQRSLVTNRYPENSEAYNEYILGRHYFRKRFAGGLQLAVQHFNQAIQDDPNFALAYTGLADSYAFSSLIGGPEIAPPAQVMSQATDNARKALQLNPSLAEAHASLGHALQNYDWDWAGAEREYREAIRLNPSYPLAHHWYAFLLMETGRTQEALNEALEAKKLDPTDMAISAGLCRQYFLARQYDRAVQECLSTRQIESTYFPGQLELGMAYEQQGKFDKALAEYQGAKASIQTLATLAGTPSAGETPSIEALLGHLYAITGQTAKAKQELTVLQQMSQARYVPPSYFAIIYVALGDKNSAFAALNQSYGQRSEHLLYLKVEPLIDPLRADPRFADLVHRVGLPD
ncbi:MAG TPA: protein kinase [Candidatus Angelobacter sp.]|nr:protein kinase [Candidatus Angelobacter sp.]